jgi:hypothetical protein
MLLNSYINKLNIINNFKNKNKNKVNFNFYFTSLVPPFIVNNIRLSFNASISEKKILIKQSYILLTWFYYLSFLDKRKNTKNKLKFFVLPLRKKKFTNTKAPMAHKNWSKEQYKFQFYIFRISFFTSFNEDSSIQSINQSLLFVLLTKQNFPQFETNLLFLKNVKFLFYFSDSLFFNYNTFLNK